MNEKAAPSVEPLARPTRRWLLVVELLLLLLFALASSSVLRP